ncbi:hypothetical protein PRIPAC_71407 [Pristionchus pacificus]|uniref:SERPIN domain-containing protein n=1 Tax=Pristionchus pacificus TaxID=54126 RepID=A0A2A6C804_PRIPA|nr:hypothetical protein PRIPAC_71407 [Pristionchus pacificus]|eukprot:PDM74289.1 hypothetical protein PRIPAC_41645 [Pristionchus pacificus]
MLNSYFAQLRMRMTFAFFVILLLILSAQANENQQAEASPVNTNYDNFYDIKDGDQILDDRIKQLEDEDQIAICKIDKTPSTLACPSSSSLSASLALSLLRHASSASKSFVLSPVSLGPALAILHDGARGMTQRELTDLLLPGCTIDDVTNHYSSLTQSLPSTGRDISFTIANQLFMNESFSFTKNYENHIKTRYNAKIEALNLMEKATSANRINEFVKNATNGKIENIINPKAISDEAAVIQINAISFRGEWETVFRPTFNQSRIFYGAMGEREITFMQQEHEYFAINKDNDFGTALLMPYKEKEYKFFALMPTGSDSSSFEQKRMEMTGEQLFNIFSKAERISTTLIFPKFKIESQLNGSNVLSKMGVSTMFTDKADFSKISDTPIWISNVEHKATVEVNEAGIEASAVTANLWERQCRSCSLELTFDRPFLYGITRNNDILFIGQFV